MGLWKLGQHKDYRHPMAPECLLNYKAEVSTMLQVNESGLMRDF